MTGVIARLVARALPAPGGVLPRLPSRFAPSDAGVAEAPADALFTPAAVVEPMAVEVTRREAGVGERRPSEVEPAPARVRATQHDADTVVPRRREPQRENVAKAVPHQARNAPEFSPLLPQGAAHASVPDAAMATATSVRSGETIPETPRAPSPAGDARDPLPAVPLARAERPARAETRAGLRRQPPQLVRKTPEPALPDIEISIGRIEVRTEGKQQPAPPRVRPVLMSLEDYLGKGKAR